LNVSKSVTTFDVSNGLIVNASKRSDELLVALGVSSLFDVEVALFLRHFDVVLLLVGERKVHEKVSSIFL
jgi:hypothetical protein